MNAKISTIRELDLTAINDKFSAVKATTLVQWSAETFKNSLVMSTSFGIQSAVMLHLVTSIIPKIPVIWIDTGYLPTATYKFAEQLSKKLELNLKVYQSDISPLRMEALYGRLWERNDVDALNLYDRLRKIIPMEMALKELGATAWLAGLRRGQTQHRQNLRRIEKQNSQYKIYPILNWNSKDVYRYLTDYSLPYHPYFELGYVTVGDWHSSRPLTADDETERNTRFKGVKQECGLHLPRSISEEQSYSSSGL